MNYHRNSSEQQTTTHPNDSTSMAAVASPLPEIRGENMRGPANVQQRLPSLTELVPDLEYTWQAGVAERRGNYYSGPPGPPSGLAGPTLIPLSPTQPSRSHRDTFSSTPAPVQLSPQVNHPSPSSSSRSGSTALSNANPREPPRPYPPYTTAMQSREGESYAAHGGQHPYYPAHTGSRDYAAPPPPPPPFGGASGPYSSYAAEYSGRNQEGKERRRGNLPKHVTDILRMWFQDHVAHPYPTEEEKQQLMHSTGLTISQISNWFINARRRSLPRMAGQSGTDTDLP